ncbi:hypothetical protein AAC387_Pa06g1664 [Persea americana]
MITISLTLPRAMHVTLTHCNSIQNLRLKVWKWTVWCTNDDKRARLRFQIASRFLVVCLPPFMLPCGPDTTNRIEHMSGNWGSSQFVLASQLRVLAPERLTDM